MDKLLKTLVLLVLLTMGNLETPNEKYKIFSGFFFEKHTDIIPYEAAFPMLFTTQLLQKPYPIKFDTNITQCNNRTNDTIMVCNLQHNLITLQELLDNNINTNFEDEFLPRVTTKSRGPRGIQALEQALTWCCNMASIGQISGIYQNQKNLQDHTNEIIDSLGDQYKNLLSISHQLTNFSHGIQNFTDKVHLSLKLVRDELNSLKANSGPGIAKQLYALTQQSWSYILFNFMQDTNRDILEKCHLNLLSEKIIKPSVLSQHLSNFSRSAGLNSLKLAIPEGKLYLYYKLKITTCKIFNGTLLIRLNIPLSDMGTKGEIFKAIPTPVTWGNTICNLQTDDYYIFKTQNYSKMIKTTDRSCNDKTYPLCLLPRMIDVTDQQQCIHHILATENVEKLQKFCMYSCQPRPQFPIITQLLPNKYLITNVKDELELNCKSEDKSRKIQPISAGTMELFVPCDCELGINHITLITKIQPCDARDVEFPKSTFLLPAIWSKLKTIKLFSLKSGIRHEFDNLSEILDSNWTINNPTFEITMKKKIEHVSLQNNEFDLFNNTKLMLYILGAWIGILTVVNLILIYCLHILTIKIKYLTPAKDYGTGTSERTRR